MIFTLSSNRTTPTSLSKEFDNEPQGTKILFTNDGIAINCGVTELNDFEEYYISQISSYQDFDLLSRYYATNSESFYNLFNYKKIQILIILPDVYNYKKEITKMKFMKNNNDNLEYTLSSINRFANGNTGIKIVDKCISDISEKAKMLIKERFGIEMMIYSKYNYKEIVKLNKWFSKYNKRVKSLLSFNNDIVNTEFLVKVEPDTFINVKIGSKIRESKNNINATLLCDSDNKIYDLDMQLYIFGKKAYYYYYHISNLI